LKLDFFNNRANLGEQAENIACKYLIQQGLVFIEKNYHCRYGEIDLIMNDKNSLVFVEVRYRKNNSFGGAKASVTYKKQKKLHTTALQYMQRHGHDRPARFDVIAITGNDKERRLEWIQNAF
jgi:putative endonuclease